MCLLLVSVTSNSSQGNSGLIKSLTDRRLALSASVVVAGYWLGRVWDKPLYFPAFLSLIKDNKLLGTGSLLGTKSPGEQKQDGIWLWENVLIMTSRNSRRLKTWQWTVLKCKAWWEFVDLCQIFLRAKLLEREKGKDRPLTSDPHMYICGVFFVVVVFCLRPEHWLGWGGVILPFLLCVWQTKKAEEKGNSLFFGLEWCRSTTRWCHTINTLFSGCCFSSLIMPSAFEVNTLLRSVSIRQTEIHTLNIAVQFWPDGCHMSLRIICCPLFWLHSKTFWVTLLSASYIRWGEERNFDGTSKKYWVSLHPSCPGAES